MNNFPDKIAAFMERYRIAPNEVWQVRSGAYAILHSALERVAAQEHLAIRELEVVALEMANKHAAVRATMAKNGHSVVSFGEAAPYNNKNSYPLAMAEKRAIDRCILKLLQVHGDIYSDAEADSFADPDQGEKGTLLRSSQYARSEYTKLTKLIAECQTGAELDAFLNAYREQWRASPFKDELQQAWHDRMDELRGGNSDF